MLLRLSEQHSIDNLQHYSPETVEGLRRLLARGAVAVPDPHRKNFYDLENGDKVYFVHVCPSGKVLLLAVWNKDSLTAAA
jgi:hypothetical protein